MGSQSSRLVNGQDSNMNGSGNLRNHYSNLSGNSMGIMTDAQGRGNFINTVFQWTFGGTQVQLTGTFNNWVNPIPLKQLENNCFEIILKLSPGVYQYKYIVDGEWRFSPEDPTCNDENGNINNIIDTTNIERSMSLIGQNNNSARFLAMGSQNNSVNFMQRNLPPGVHPTSSIISSEHSSVNAFNASSIQNRQMHMQLLQQPQQLMQMQLQQNQQQQYQNQHQQHQQFNIQNAQMMMQQQQGNPNFQELLTQNMQLLQQMHPNTGKNPQSYERLLQQQQQQQMAQFQMAQAQMQQQQQYLQYQQTQQSNGINGNHNGVSAMQQQMYLRGIQNLDKSQLLIKAHILQQNQTNFDEAFKDKAPPIPPHLQDVMAIRKKNVENISIQREKELRPEDNLPSIFASKQKRKNTMDEESSEKPVELEGGLTYKNSQVDDAEVLMHVFQPSHSLSSVDHVVLNHVGVDHSKQNKDYNVSCTTLRFKTKYTTYQVYTSKYDTQIII